MMRRMLVLLAVGFFLAAPVALFPVTDAFAGPQGCDDSDTDGICDDGDASGIAGDNPCQGGQTAECDDNCVTISNADQADDDADGVGQVCDNCTAVANARLGTLGAPAQESFQTTTGGQLDSDNDGFGNHCDANFDNTGQVVGGTDTASLLASFNKDRSGTDCGSGGDERCEEYDLDNSGQFIGGVDLNAALAGFNNPEGPKCDACPLECSGPGCP